MIEFVLNDQKVQTGLPNGSLLLDFIRNEQGLMGTKIGCREGDCGACTVLVGHLSGGKMHYQQITSCLTPIGNVQGKHVVTIEGLNLADLTPVQRLMVEEGGTQCGFCTVGFVVALTGYCLSHSPASYPKALAAIDGNICRCTGYKPIERAAAALVNELTEKDPEQTVNWLIEKQFLPAYFKKIPQMLAELPAVPTPSPQGVLVGGGTDLYVQRPDQFWGREVHLIAQSPELRFIRADEGRCVLGGATTVTDMAESAVFQKLFPSLADHVKLIASSPIRNSSTIAGNFVNASPIGDLTAFFLALDAQITLRRDGQDRTLFLKDFYLDYKELDKNEGEVISKISFAIPPAEAQFNLEKVSKRIHLDIASVNSAMQIMVSGQVITGVHLSAGGVGPTPKYLQATGAFLQGKTLSARTVIAANEVLQTEVSPISDVRGTAAYKRLLLRQLFFAHFIKLFPQQITLEALL